MYRLAGNGIDAGGGDKKSVFFVEADGSHIVGVDVKIEAARRQAFGFGNQRGSDA
jgi:hypothetical protein